MEKHSIGMFTTARNVFVIITNVTTRKQHLGKETESPDFQICPIE